MLFIVHYNQTPFRRCRRRAFQIRQSATNGTGPNQRRRDDGLWPVQVNLKLAGVIAKPRHKRQQKTGNGNEPREARPGPRRKAPAKVEGSHGWRVERLYSSHPRPWPLLPGENTAVEVFISARLAPGGAGRFGRPPRSSRGRGLAESPQPGPEVETTMDQAKPDWSPVETGALTPAGAHALS